MKVMGANEELPSPPPTSANWNNKQRLLQAQHVVMQTDELTLGLQEFAGKFKPNKRKQKATSCESSQQTQASGRTHFLQAI